MSERLNAERHRLATDCLCEFMNTLRLNGEPMVQGRPYNPVEVAHAGEQYLKVIGIRALHHVDMSSRPDRYLAEIWVGNAQEDAAYDLPSVMLGTVVGEAVFNPSSILDTDQKHSLIGNSIRILHRTNEVDGRGSAEDFVDVMMTCAEDYSPGKDLTKLRQKMHKLREDLDPNFSRWRRRAGAMGGMLLQGLQCYGPMYGTDGYVGGWEQYPGDEGDEGPEDGRYRNE